MTNAKRLPMFRLLAFVVLVLTATSWAQNRPPILEQIAKTYGLDSWDQIQGDPLHLEWGNHGAVQSFSHVGVGAQDRQGHL